MNLNPLTMRVTQCPDCHKIRLVNVAELTDTLQCTCSRRFVAAEELLLAPLSESRSPYCEWTCPSCEQRLLVPSLAIVIPGLCPCGLGYPYVPDTPRRWTLDSAETAVFGNDSLMAENMLQSYRAAQRFHYDIEPVCDGTYLVKNPTTGSQYAVSIGEITSDMCECDVFSQGKDTCIHIEHVRLRLGLPSPSLLFAECREFAYAWVDKAALPPRIRIGCMGDIDSSVRGALQGITVISDASVLEVAKKRVEKHGIAFHVLLSAKMALTVPDGSRCDSHLSNMILREGRAFLATTIPQLRDYQLDGAIFLASVQRAWDRSAKWSHFRSTGRQRAWWLDRVRRGRRAHPRRSARCEKRGVKSSQQLGVAKLGTDGPPRRSSWLSSAWWTGPPPIPRHGPPRATNRMTRPPSRSPPQGAARGFWIRAWGQREPALQGTGRSNHPAQWLGLLEGWLDDPRHSRQN